MNQVFKVRLSIFSTLLTVISLGVLIFVLISVRDRPFEFITVLIILLLMVISALLYAPYKIQLNNYKLTYRSPLRTRDININEIEEIKLFQPTMGAIRVFGSSGFMGYYGIFKEGDIGRYYASYGKASESFLITLKKGDKLVLGCENPQKVVSFVNDCLRK